ncbi:MAG: hypothetical protein KF819_35890 [Labilithrix sp.]|nr:hypothetical protein [Labilithrix sp.]
MSSLPPFACAAGVGRVLGAGGGALCWVALGELDVAAVLTAGMPGWLPLEGCVPARFGSDPRPGGGGGFDGEAAGVDTEAARIDAEGGAGGADGLTDGGAAGIAPDTGGAPGTPLWLAGSGNPTSVFFIPSFAFGAAGTCELDPGGGGGTADVRVELFFPRPSKISRSEPPLLSSDIRVS